MADSTPAYVWKDRKRTFLGLPLSFTRYRLTNDRLITIAGLFNTKEEEIRLYRILDLTLTRKLGERLLGLGTIKLLSADRTTPEYLIKRIKKSRDVKELLSRMIEEERVRMNVRGREMYDGDDDID